MFLSRLSPRWRWKYRASNDSGGASLFARAGRAKTENTAMPDTAIAAALAAHWAARVIESLMDLAPASAKDTILLKGKAPGETCPATATQGTPAFLAARARAT